MKKTFAVILSLFLVILCGCSKSGNISNVTVDYGKSEIFTQQDMDSAISAINKKFTSWSGCELHSITFTSDSICEDNVGNCNGLREGANFNECIVFDSSFHSPKNGGDGWEPDNEYTGWSWCLARKDNGAWELLSWGYA
jgi:hypothetical protein